MCLLFVICLLYFLESGPNNGTYLLKIKNRNIAQTGTDKISPSKKEATRQAKNPPMAKPILRLIAPQIAGTAPTSAPLRIEPIIAPIAKVSII